MNRIFFKLYGPPTAIATIAFLAFQWSDNLLQNFLPTGNDSIDILSELFFKYFRCVPLAANVVMLFSGLWLLLATYKLWKVERGELHIYDECCPRCGEITIRKVGRYGAYMKCPTCGKNTGI